MPLTDIKSILEVAIGREEEAYEFYANVAERMTNPAVKEIFGQLSQDELGHKMFLLAAQKDDQIVAKLPVPADYKVAEATELPALSIDMKPADAVALAMKKEQQSVELYRGLAQAASDPTLAAMFDNLARMELGHKARLETMFVDIGYPEVF